MLEDTVLRARGQIIAWLTRNCHPPRLGRVLELAMATVLRDLEPAILLQELKDLGDFHVVSIHGLKS